MGPDRMRLIMQIKGWDMIKSKRSNIAKNYMKEESRPSRKTFLKKIMLNPNLEF